MPLKTLLAEGLSGIRCWIVLIVFITTERTSGQ